MSRFTGRVAIVTGAAGGIGLAACERFAAEGASVVAVDLATSDLSAAVAAAESAGGAALAVGADVTKSDEVAGYVQAAMDNFGRVDVLFNNAGIEGTYAPMTEYTEESFDQVIAVNVRGVWLGIKHAAPAMIAGGGGAIVNTASVAGLFGARGISAYSASKHAVAGLTKSAALELAASGVRVNAVCPAPIETRMMRSLETFIGGDQADEVRKQFAERLPAQRYGEPHEVAALVAFLASDEASFITGSLYPIDGGYSAGR
ncbi:SDR family NAD(P)-dependent oxidoreductase [Candidatus Poriferisodalis sp.]|uniref:SDR family NAD(P)-dependent oxidoreductase n=1 Tax=Candidatus Poriferisodalis sp. TaxID=3101277 RepID=UPI003B016426